MNQDVEKEAEGAADQRARGQRNAGGTLSSDTVVSIKIQHLISGALALIALFFGAFLFIDDRYERDGEFVSKELFDAQVARIDNLTTELTAKSDALAQLQLNFITQIGRIGDIGTLEKRLESACFQPKKRDQEIKRLLEEIEGFLRNTLYKEIENVVSVNLNDEGHKINALLGKIKQFEKEIGASADYCTFSDGG